MSKQREKPRTVPARGKIGGTSNQSLTPKQSLSERMKGNQNARKYPLNPVPVALDKRTRLGRYVLERAGEIFNDLGGREYLSAIKQGKVFQLVYTDIYIDVIDDWAFRNLNWIDKRKKTLRPILLERNRLIETSLKLAQALGLDRQAKPAPDFKTWVAEFDRNKEQQQPNERTGTNEHES